MTTREKAKEKAIRTVKADLKKSDGWRLGEFSLISAYDMKNDNIEKFVFLCESHHGLHEVWTWDVEVDVDLRKKAVIIERDIKEL